MMRSRWVMGALCAVLGLSAGCGKKADPVAPVNAPAVPATPAPAKATAPEPRPAEAKPAPAPDKAAVAGEEKAPDEAAMVAPPPEEGAAEKPPAEAKGRIRLEHKRPGSEAMRELAAGLAESKLFVELVEELNKTLKLPTDLTIRFEDCGEVNAFYDPEQKLVSMCWELLEHTVKQFSKGGRSEEETASGFLNATMFTFFHELGHALVHLLDLPITGKEEDVVDQLATWALVDDGGEEGALMAIDGALSFIDEDTEDEEPALWGEHSLDKQRFFNIVCWVYGSKPERYGELTEERGGPLPAERAERCSDEWARLKGSWERLLAEHLR